jgi:hypothetical protein
MQKRILWALRESNPDTISSGSTLLHTRKIARNRFTRLRANFLYYNTLRLSLYVPHSYIVAARLLQFRQAISLARPTSFPTWQLTFVAGGGW